MGAAPSDRYKWVALSNATLAVLLATLDGSITIIAMPAIFRGIGLDPLVPSNSFYLLWMILGYLVVTSVLIVSLGRLGDMVGRVKIYNLGFVIYTAASLLLAVDWLTGPAGARYLIVFRIVQGVGGACLLANAAAIITDAFPRHQRGMALGINNIVGVSGTFIGLILGGILAPIDWRLVFLISVPVGLFGAVWAYVGLRELSVPRRASIDWAGNVTFALGLILVMVAVTYGIRPAAGHPTGWASPRVIALLAASFLSLAAFVAIELRTAEPMFRLSLFRIRAFTFGTLSTFLASIARGGLMFMLIIWLQGIWLPQHGYSFEKTPLWAGIYMLPLTAGILVSGPLSGYLSDRYGARPFASGGMLLTAVGFTLLLLLPTDFAYAPFGLILLLIGAAMGMFAAPNRAAVMNSLPAADRGAGGAMNQTFQNSAQVLSIGIFFTLMIVGLAATLPETMRAGLEAHGVSAAAAQDASTVPPVSILFSAFLGSNPIEHLLDPQALAALSAQNRATLTGRSFFPELLSAPFRDGLHAAFLFAIVACLLAAVASLMRGGTPPDEQEPHPTLLIAPDSFKGTFSAAEVATAIGHGVELAGAEAVLCPVADGGEGTMDALLVALGGAHRAVTVSDPLGRPVQVPFALLADGRTAVVESAAASGLHHLGPSPGPDDAVRASTVGTGELIVAAHAAGARTILVAVGGSATTDGGRGALDAIERAGGIDGARLRVVCDVDTSFERAAIVFARQKGADDAAVALLTRRLEAQAGELPRDPRGVPMTGCAGGLSGGLWAALDAELVPGADFVLDAIGFDGLVAAAAGVVTGEGRLDDQTLAGKLIGRIARRCAATGTPLHAVVGQNALTPDQVRELGLASVTAASSRDAMVAAGRTLGERVGGGGRDHDPPLQA